MMVITDASIEDSNVSTEQPPKGVLELTRRDRAVLLVLLFIVLVAGVASYAKRHHWWTDQPTVTGESIYDYRQMIDINVAGWEELSWLRGIGPAKAKAIVEYRSGHNGFTSIDELSNVPGISAEMVDALRDDIELSPARDAAAEQ